MLVNHHSGLFGCNRADDHHFKASLILKIYYLERYSKVTIAEVEMPSNPQSRQLFHDNFDYADFDLYIVLTETWFKGVKNTENSPNLNQIIVPNSIRKI